MRRRGQVWTARLASIKSRSRIEHLHGSHLGGLQARSSGLRLNPRLTPCDCSAQSRNAVVKVVRHPASTFTSERAGKARKPEPVSIATPVFAAFNSLIKGANPYGHYKDVPCETKQLHTNIDRAAKTINIARRLIRSKAHYLDPRLIEDARESIATTDKVLILVRDCIEGCRKDLELRNTVGVRNRVVWLLWKNDEFLSQLQTLGNCLTALDREMLRLEMAPPPLVLVNGGLLPPAYSDKDHGRGRSDHNSDDAQDQDNHIPPFSRSSTRRLRPSKTRLVQAKSDRQPGFHHERSQDGEEGYESEEGTGQPEPLSALKTESRKAAIEHEQLALFASAKIGIGISESVFVNADHGPSTRHVTVSQGSMCDPSPGALELMNEGDNGEPTPLTGQTLYGFPARNPWRSSQDNVFNPVPGAFKLLVEDFNKDRDAVEGRTLQSFPSRNPWRSFTAQSSTTTLVGPGSIQEEASSRQEHIEDSDNMRQAAYNDVHQRIGNVLGQVTSAAATPCSVNLLQCHK